MAVEFTFCNSTSSSVTIAPQTPKYPDVKVKEAKKFKKYLPTVCFFVVPQTYLHAKSSHKLFDQTVT